MNNTATPTVNLAAQAETLLPQVQVVYHGQTGDAYAFTVTHDGIRYTPVFDGAARTWRCDCDAFDPQAGQCLHTELVKAWRRAQQKDGPQNGRQAGSAQRAGPPPPPANGDAPPPPQPLPKARASGGQSPPPKARKRSSPPPAAFPTPATGVSAWSKQVAEALLAPFPVEMVGWKAQATTKDGSRAMAVAYIDSRAVQDRLDAVVGPENWSDSYRVLGEQHSAGVLEIVVECRLTVLGVTKSDVGAGEDHKSAYSDAFKRAAVKMGVGRYLYALPKRWVAYDPKKRQLKETPQLPAWAV
ncbi:MAG: hypothetical protein D6790_11035, partial [Caldilineae bacterium]